MSTEKRPPVSWKTIERVADEAKRDRLEPMSDEEIDAELRAAGFAPDDAGKVVDRALARRRRPPTWVLVAAAAAVLLALFAWKRREVQAFFERRPEPIEPDRLPPPSQPAQDTRGTDAAADAAPDGAPTNPDKPKLP